MGFPLGVGGAIICRYGSYGVPHMVLSNSCSKRQRLEWRNTYSFSSVQILSELAKARQSLSPSPTPTLNGRSRPKFSPSQHLSLVPYSPFLFPSSPPIFDRARKREKKKKEASKTWERTSRESPWVSFFNGCFSLLSLSPSRCRLHCSTRKKNHQRGQSPAAWTLFTVFFHHHGSLATSK